MLNFFRQQSNSVKNDVLSGLTVALALVPEAIAFAFVAGVSPLIGLYSAFFIGVITAIVGGRPGMISGATGAMAVVVVALVADHGVAYLFPTVILCGLLQIAIGIGRLGKLIRMVPHSVMLGFVNGLAIVIGLAQLGSFKTLSEAGDLVYINGYPLSVMLGLVALTMAIIYFLPKITTAVPASLAAILTVTLLSVAINQASAAPDQGNLLATVGDMLRTNTKAKQIADAKNELTSASNDSSHATMTLVAVQVSDELDLDFDATTNSEGDNTDLVNPNVMGSAPQTAGAPDTAMAAAEADAGISGGLPVPFFMEHAIVPLNWKTLKIIFPIRHHPVRRWTDRITDDSHFD